jgi:DNA polymerase
MDGDRERTPTELAQLARQHVDSLKAAGIRWLPAAQFAVHADNPIEPTISATIGAVQSLFDNRESNAPLDPAERQTALEVLRQRVSKCVRCAQLASSRTQTVFGVGKMDPDVCFIGEAPGADEDARGEPFVGAAGQLLNRIIAACGMTREEVYICNILKCRPPGNRLPQADEAANCREFLDAQLDFIRPKVICALGACAVQNLLNTTASIGKLRGQFRDYRGIPVMCTYHPAYLLRSPDKKKDVWEDMKKLMKHLGRPIKGT